MKMTIYLAHYKNLTKAALYIASHPVKADATSEIINNVSWAYCGATLLMAYTVPV